MSKNSFEGLNILFVTPAPVGISPGQRFRHEQYLEILKQKGIRFSVSSFYSREGWKKLYRNGLLLRKVMMVLGGCIRRFFLLFRMGSYSHIYIHREATPVGPAFFEWCAARLLKKKIVYDFDDAIWLPVSSEQNKLAAPFRNFSKTGRICKWSYRVSVGNQYLAAYAKKFTDRVSLLPTVVDTSEKFNVLQDQHTARPCIGWTGSFSTLAYLDILIPVLQELEKEIDFDFIVIADKDPALPLKNYIFFPWAPSTEVSDLLRFHIGVMPLYDDEVSRGKCGFKAIQYMSVGIPALVSPVGVNTEIVTNGRNGFVCADAVAWKQQLRVLLQDEKMRVELGKEARHTILERYSVSANTNRFLALFGNN